MSETITTSIHTIASISLAMLVVGALTFSTINLNDAFNQRSDIESDLTLSDLAILQLGEVNESSSSFGLFAKNIGERTLGSLEFLSIFLDGLYVTFNSSVVSELRYNVSRIDINNVDKAWQVQETILINIYLSNSDTLGLGQHKLVLFAENGITSDRFLFSV